MQFEFSCPECGQSIAATTDQIGVQALCPTCSHAFDVPAPQGFKPQRKTPPPPPRSATVESQSPPSQNATPPPQQKQQGKNPLSFVGAIFVILVVLGIRGCFSGASKEDKLKDYVGQGLNTNRQRLFQQFHPVGTAKYVKVNSIELNPTAVTVVCTIHWESPFISDGYTKVALRYDREVERWTRHTILETNGMSNEQADEIAFDVGFLIGRGVSDNR